MHSESDATEAAAPVEPVAGGDPPAFAFKALHTRALAALEGSEGPAPKLLAVIAPIGYGKTVLMSHWYAALRRIGKQCLWVTLDERSASAEALLASIENQIRQRDDKLHPTQALFRGHRAIANRVDALVAQLDRSPLPLSLFIDNLNHCGDAALGEMLDRLVFGTRSSVRWVLSSTHELPLDSTRAQLEGLMRQLGPAELSLDKDEIGELLGPELSRRLGAAGVADVARVTEGWPAAARLAQIILSQSPDPIAALKSFSGSDAALAQLLNRQVLSAFQPELRDFLYGIAPLRRFTVELCSHVTGDESARTHLATLNARNVFLIPLDRQRQWFRLHGLFREFLLGEAALGADRKHEILLRAAQWCDRHGVWRDALDYALASGSVATARRILEQRAPSFVRDQGQTLPYIDWIETLHAQGHRADPEAEYWYVWALAFQRRYDDARRCGAQLGTRVRQRGRNAQGAQTASEGDLERRLAILLASIDSLSDHGFDAQRRAAAWLASAPAPDDDPFNRAAAHCIQAHGHCSALRFVDAHNDILAARAAAFQTRSANVDGWVASYAALVKIGEGDYAHAYPEIADALVSARAQLGDESGICGTMSLVAALCAVEMGLDDDARQLLEFGLRSARRHGFLESAACGLEAAVKLWRGNDPGVIAQLREIAGCYPPRLDRMLSCYLVQRLLRLGRQDEARAETERIGLLPRAHAPQRQAAGDEANGRMEILLTETRIQWLIANGQFKPAGVLIADAALRAKQRHCAAHAVTLALASAEIALRSSDPALATRHVTRAVSLAATRTIVRPFADQAACLAAVVADTKISAWGFATVDERHFFADRCRTLRFADPALRDRLLSLHEEQPQLLAHLTTREMELLGYIDAGLSNQQIADRADLSLTTVKWHLQNLYAKLGVTRRSAALARARVLNLMP